MVCLWEEAGLAVGPALCLEVQEQVRPCLFPAPATAGCVVVRLISRTPGPAIPPAAAPPLPNLLDRGEADYIYGTKNSSNFNLVFW